VPITITVTGTFTPPPVGAAPTCTRQSDVSITGSNTTAVQFLNSSACLSFPDRMIRQVAATAPAI
jgi:hypothetical protein